MVVLWIRQILEADLYNFFFRILSWQNPVSCFDSKKKKKKIHVKLLQNPTKTLHIYILL